MEVTRSYSIEEILDRHIKSTVGSECGLAQLREKGFVSFPRTLTEKFPRALKKMPRVPLYFEFLLDTGAEFDKTAAELDLVLDRRSFRALPVWHACAAQERASADYDLIAVNYKLPFHSYNMTQDNPWLAELSERHPYAEKVMINARTAAAKGIADGDPILLETPHGASAQGIAKVSECIHPEAAGIASCFGHWAKARATARGRGIHFNSLLPYDVSQIDPLAGLMDACVKIKVTKLANGRGQGWFFGKELRL
jgi:anaerobic selenocysteine-containing dehydrogenase